MKNEIIGYASVKGLLHEQKKIPNQDSYIVKRYKFGTVIVVADGLGSHKYSDRGSKAVCKSLCLAIQIWNQYSQKDIRLLIPLIHSFWGMEIFPYPKSECGSTCLFAFITSEKKLYVGQLGDGDIYVSINGEVQKVKEKDDDFSNFTSSMSGIASYNEWSIKEVDFNGKEMKLCLMTDGVSETLIEDKKIDFVNTLWKKLREKMDLLERNKLVYILLKNWNKINSGDDRTIVCYEIK